MTTGSPYGLLISFALPLILGDLFQQLYNMTDTWVIGNYATTDEYAAVGACAHILNLIIKTFIGLSTGVGIIISRSFGAGDKEKVSKGSSAAAVIALICCVIFTLGGCFIAPIALKASKVPEVVFDYAKSYLNIIFSFVSAQVIYNMGAGILRAVGDSRRPFLFLVIASMLNVILDMVFVIVLKMGIKGVAWATVISQCVAALLTTIELFRTNLDVKLSVSTLTYDKSIAKDMVGLGTPTAIQMAVTSLSNVFIQSYVNGLGVFFISGFATFSKCEQILFMAANSMSAACMTFVSQNLGAKNLSRAKEGVKASKIILAVYACTVSLMIVVFAPQIARFFNSNPDVIPYSIMSLRRITPFFITQGLGILLMGALRGCGDTKTPLYMQIGFSILFRQVSMFIITHYIAYTPSALMLAHPISWIVLCIAMHIAYGKSILMRKKEGFNGDK